MIRRVEDFQGPGGSAPPPPLPPDHVLDSGAVFFPGAFDQHGVPLIVFPVDGLSRLSSEVSTAEVVDFIGYFLSLHKDRQDQGALVSVVADLRSASLSTTRFIAETLLLLELQKRTVHSVYVLQPKKKDVLKLLLKLLSPSKASPVLFRKVLLKETFELSNHIDRSQLPASLGGYLMYCHRSWVTFIKEIDVFVQDFLSVVRGLPTCISHLQALSTLPMPSTFRELRHFCSTNEARFQQLRRDLGLDELLNHCETVLDKLRHPEKDACYQAMAGTTLFTHTAFDMLQNYNRITATVEKVDLMWQQTFSKARVQLQVLQLRDDALQITEHIETLLQDKLQPYNMEMAQDAAQAGLLVSEFTVSIHTPAMALVGRAEDVIHTLVDVLPLDSRSQERWVVDLERLKEKLRSTVHYTLQTLRAVNSYHQYYNKANSWYRLVLCENFLQELLSGVEASSDLRRRQNHWGTVPAWRKKLSAFLKKNPPPDMQELLHLAHLSSVIPDGQVQQEGRRLSQRCMSLRKLIISSEPVAVAALQSALQWQYEFLRSDHIPPPPAHRHAGFVDVQPTDPNRQTPSELHRCGDAGCCGSDSTKCRTNQDVAPVTRSPAPSGQPTSFNSSFDGAAGSHLEGTEGTRDWTRPALSQTRASEENVVGVWGSEDHRDSSSSSVHVVSKVTVDSLNFEIKVKRSAALPKNPWLSLPVEDLENSYTVTITQNPQPTTDHGASATLASRCRDQLTQTEGPKGPKAPSPEAPQTPSPEDTQTGDWSSAPLSPSEDSDLSVIHDILSSTIRDQSTCATEGTSTLIWDSYDLHDQYVEGVSDMSLKDWDVKEQEGLKEVETLLDRADEILAEEENVLAQEAMLDVLLKEDRPSPWPSWPAEVQLCQMSSTELADAGVLGLEDCPDPGLTELKTFSEHGPDMDNRCHRRPDLLMELQKVHILDELIVEENSKIHELRRCSEEEASGTGIWDPNPARSHSEERDVFRLQLEKEREEVEELERSLDEEQEVKKHRARDDVRCPNTEEGPQEEDDGPLWAGGVHAEPGSDAAQGGLDQLESNTNKNLCLEDPDSAPKPSSLNETGLKRDSAEVSAERGVHPLGLDWLGGSAAVRSPESSPTLEMHLRKGVFDPGGGSARLQASLPVSGRVAQHEPPCSTEVRTAHLSSADPRDAELEPPDLYHLQVLPLNVKEHSSNNNNNNNRNLQLESKTTHEEERSVCTEGPQTDGGPRERPPDGPRERPPDGPRERPPDGPRERPPDGTRERPPDGPLEFDPGGRDGLQVSEDTRTSGFRIQTQLNTHTTQVSGLPTPIVLDTGSGLMKAGFADQDLPSVLFPTIIGVPKYEEIMNSSAEREGYIGHEAQHMRGVLALRHPIRNGIIRNWDDMEKIWHHTFQQLCVDPEDHPVLLTEAPMNPLENRQRMVEVMFECFGVPFMYVAMQAVLALYAAGTTTGVVLDSGDGVSHSVPVFDGYCLPHAVQRFPLAGLDVTMHLQKLLQEQGVSMSTTAELEIVREMKEECCRVALNYQQELSGGAPSGGGVHYTMPDGQVVNLHTERFRAPEILFKPALIGRDHYGMHESIFKSVLSSDVDLRRCLLGNIVLSGGNTLLPGLPERLQAEIRGLVTSDLWDGVRVSSPSDRDFSVWSGGAVLASGAGSGPAWISQYEYEEFGPQIVFRKCF